MAITDKVIELTPVNKKKNIIFYIIMGVLLATTVLFLVLYLIKPNASTGEVSGISVTHNLYVDDDGTLVAVKGQEYVACAVVGYSGEVDTSVVWDLPGFDNKTPDTITQEEKDSVKKLNNSSVGGTIVEDGDVKYIYCKFTPSSKTPNNSKVTITVHSGQTDKNGKSVVEVPLVVTVRDKGAADAELTSIFPGSETDNPAAMEKISDREYTVDIPLVASRTRFGARIKQLPFVDKFNNSAVVSHIPTEERTPGGDVIYSDSIVVSVDSDDIVTMGMYLPENTDRFSFDVKKTGTAIITVGFNEYNNDEKFEIKIRVNVKTPEQMNIITKYRLFEQPVGTTEPPASQNGVKRISMYVGQAFDLQSHIAVTPWSRKSDWARNIAPLVITEENSTMPSGAVKQHKLQNGNLALRAESAGSVKVKMTDRTPGSLSASIEFIVDVKYRAANFGYYAGEDYSGAPSNEYNAVAVKGGNGSIVLSYVIYGVTAEKVDGKQFLADVKVENPNSAIEFQGMDSDGIIRINTAAQVSKLPSGAVVMQATVNYTVRAEIGDGAVQIVITPLVAESENAKLTVNMNPVAEAHRIEFIEDFDEKFKDTDNGFIRDYAKFEVHSVPDNTHKMNATLTLNMSGQATNFTLGDLVKFTDNSGNPAQNAGIGRTTVSAENGENLSLTSASLNSRLTPKVLESTSASATIIYTLSGSDSGHNRLVLTVNIIDTPLEIVLDKYADGLTYGYIEDPVSVSLPTVKQKYASGKEREPQAYSLAIFFNHRARMLTASNPVEDDYLAGSDKQQNSYVYFFTKEDFDAIGGNGASLDDMRARALVAVGGNGNSRAKYVYLLKDLYALALENKISGVDRMGIAFYPADGDYNDDSVAAYYSLTLTRKIDKLSVNGLTADEDGNYIDYASGGSTVSVALAAHIRTGGDTGSPTFSRAISYGNETARYGNLERVSALYNEQSYTDTTEFAMPQVAEGSAKAVIEFKASFGSMRITYSVENRTLQTASVKLYKDSAYANAYADGESIWLSALKDSADSEITVYYEIKYPFPTDGKDYIKFDDVRFAMSNAGIAGLYDPATGDALKLISKPGKPSDVTDAKDMVHRGSFVIRADGGEFGNVNLQLLPSITDENDGSQKIGIHVYAPSQGVMLGDFTGESPNNDLTLTIGAAGEMPKTSLAVKPLFNASEYYVSELGNTYYTIQIADVTDSASGGKLSFFYDRNTGRLEIASNGKAVGRTGVSVTVREYVADKGAAGTAGNTLINTFTGSINVEVKVRVYSLDLSVNGTTYTAATAHNVETTGASGTQAQPLGAVFNGGVSGVDNPSRGNVDYIITRNRTPIAENDTTAVFNISKKADGSFELVYKNDVTNIGSDLYELKAVCDGKESATVTLTLTTSATLLRFDDSNARDVFDTAQIVDVRARVYNAGTNAETTDTVSYKVVNPNNDSEYSAAATVSSDGKVTVKISSGTFRIKASFGDKSEYVTIRVNNKVTEIRTTFDGQTAGASPGSVEITRIYDGTSATDINLADFITLVGANGMNPYDGAEWTTTTSGGVFTITDNVLRFTGTAGRQSFVIRAKSTPNAESYDIVKTVNVTAVVPKLSVSLGGQSTDHKTVNLMDDAPATEFAVNVESGVDAQYEITDVTLTGDEVGAGKIFSYADGKLTVDTSKIDTATSDDLKTYTFVVSAKVGGKQVAQSATATAKITLTADRTFAAPLFEITDENNAPVANGRILTLGSGSYKTVNRGGYVLSFTASGNAGQSVPSAGGAVTFDKVGSFTVSAVLNKYGKTFDAGSYTFGVKGDVNSIESTLSLVETNGADETATVISGTVGADYVDNADKKIISYVVDFAATGETFTLDELKAGLLKVSGNALSEVPSYPKMSGTTAEWRFRVDNPGDVSLWLSLEKNGRYYTTGESKAKFTMNGAPDSLTVAVNADSTFEPTFVKDAAFKGNYTVRYDVVSGDNLISLIDKNGKNGYVALVTENGGVASVRATLEVTSGHYAGTRLTYEFDITVQGISKSKASKTSGEVFLNGADGKQTFDVCDAFTVTDGDESDEYTVTARILSGGGFADIEKLVGETVGQEKFYRITAKSTASGGEVRMEITVTFDGGSHGAYADTFEYTLCVLPTAQAGSGDYVVTAGESITLSMADAGGVKVGATYTLDNESIATLSGDKLTAKIGAGGTAAVTANPTVSGGIFGDSKALKPVTFSVRVRGLALAGGTELKLKNGDTKTLSTADFVFGGLGSATASGVTRIETDSDLVIVDGARVQVVPHANVYTSNAPEAERVSKFANVKITASDTAFGTYVGEFEIEILPTVVNVTASVSVNGSAASGDVLPLVSGDRLTVTVDVTAADYIVTGTPVAKVQGGDGADCAVRQETIENGVRIICDYDARSGGEKLEITYSLANKTDLTLFAAQLTVVTLPTVEMTANAADTLATTAVANGETYNEYTFASVDGKFNKITLDGLDGATVEADAADNVVGNVITVSGGANSLSVKVYAVSAGVKTFTPKVTVVQDGSTLTAERTLRPVSFTAIDLGELDVEAVSGGTAQAEFAIGDIVEIKAEVSGAANAEIRCELVETTGGAMLKNELLTASAAGEYTVKVTAKAARKTLEKTVTVKIAEKPTLSVAVTGSGSNKTVSVDNAEDFDVTYKVVSGKAYATFSGLKADETFDGTFTENRLAADGVTVVEVTAKVKSGAYKNLELKTVITHIVTAETEPTFVVNVTDSALEWGEEFTVEAYVTSGNATVAVVGNTATVTHIAAGNVTVIAIAEVKDKQSPYAGRKYTQTVTVANAEPLPQESDFEMTVNAADATISFAKAAENAEIVSVTQTARAVDSVVTIAEDKRSAAIDWTKLQGKDAEFAVVVKVTTVHYGDKTFEYAVTLKGIEFAENKIVAPEYMGGIVSVESKTADVTVGIDENGTLTAETTQESEAGYREITVTVTFGAASFDVNVHLDVVKTEPAPDIEP